MENFDYPIVIKKGKDGIFVVTLKDFSGATQGITKSEALTNAIDLLETVIAYAIYDKDNIPPPSPAAKGEVTIRPSSLTIAKIKLYREMKKQEIIKAELARRMHCNPRQVDRLLDIRHKSRFDQIDSAFLALGKRLEIEVRKTIQ